MTIQSILTVCAFALVSSAAADEWETDTARAKEFTELNQKLTNAYASEDVEALRGMLSDQHVHNNVFGVALTKDQFLSDIETGVLEFISYETPKIAWKFTNETTAIATGIIVAKAERDGKPVPAERFLFTRIWVKEGDTWRVLLFHNTMAKPK
ncbi:MAG: nuclear transport factor 2 family protein [Verrucomicrobiota bacterium]